MSDDFVLKTGYFNEENLEHRTSPLSYGLWLLVFVISGGGLVIF
jgi:hypothetical protein